MLNLTSFVIFENQAMGGGLKKKHVVFTKVKVVEECSKLHPSIW